MTRWFRSGLVVSIQDEETLRRFHEEIGLKTEAWTENGWLASLRTYFDPALERGIDSAGLSFNWRELRESEEKRNEFATQASRQFTVELERATGGQVYACLRAIEAAERANVGPPPCIASGATPVVPIG